MGKRNAVAISVRVSSCKPKTLRLYSLVTMAAELSSEALEQLAQCANSSKLADKAFKSLVKGVIAIVTEQAEEQALLGRSSRSPVRPVCFEPTSSHKPLSPTPMYALIATEAPALQDIPAITYKACYAGLTTLVLEASRVDASSETIRFERGSAIAYHGVIWLPLHG